MTTADTESSVTTSLTASTVPVESVSLFYRDGGSDKVYHANILPAGDGFVVHFAYGRRGSALVAGEKTAAPVPLEKAKAIFDKIVGEKTSKGYTSQEGGQLFAGGADAGRVSGHVPQLLNDATEAELADLLADDAWVMQTKHDGRRTMVHRQGATVVGSNRRGLIVALPQELHDCLLMVLPDDTVLDGELVGTTLFVFDTTRWAGENLTDAVYAERWDTLASRLANDTEYVRRVETSVGRAEKTTHLERVRVSRGEGVVLKRRDAPYRAGRPASGGNQRKFKFTQSATCRVLSVSSKKRSVEVGVLSEGSDAMRDACRSVGSITISPNFAVPAVGALIEVRYLYYFEGGSLYQSIYQGERDDKTRPDTLDSLKRKQTEVTEGDDEPGKSQS